LITTRPWTVFEEAESENYAIVRTQAVRSNRETSRAAGSARAVEIFSRANEKRTTIMVVRNV
jgi:hypothetical protein